jgi:hypothetical protein
VHVIRGCHETAIRTVAVYSDVDRTAQHMRFTHEAVQRVARRVRVARSRDYPRFRNPASGFRHYVNIVPLQRDHREHRNRSILGLLAAMARDLLANSPRRRLRHLALASLILFGAKIGWELATGGTLAAGPLPAGVNVAPLTHLVGGLTGALCAWLAVGQRKIRPGPVLEATSLLVISIAVASPAQGAAYVIDAALPDGGYCELPPFHGQWFPATDTCSLPPIPESRSG